MSQPDAKESKHAALSFLMHNWPSLPKVFTIARLNLLQPEIVYCTRREELTWLLKAAEKAGICLDHSTINKSSNPRIVRVCSANKGSSIKSSRFPGSRSITAGQQ